MGRNRTLTQKVALDERTDHAFCPPHGISTVPALPEEFLLAACLARNRRCPRPVGHPPGAWNLRPSRAGKDSARPRDRPGYSVRTRPFPQRNRGTRARPRFPGRLQLCLPGTTRPDRGHALWLVEET